MPVKKKVGVKKFENRSKSAREKKKCPRENFSKNPPVKTKSMPVKTSKKCARENEKVAVKNVHQKFSYNKKNVPPPPPPH